MRQLAKAVREQRINAAFGREDYASYEASRAKDELHSCELGLFSAEEALAEINEQVALCESFLHRAPSADGNGVGHFLRTAIALVETQECMAHVAVSRADRVNLWREKLEELEGILAECQDTTDFICKPHRVLLHGRIYLSK